MEGKFIFVIQWMPVKRTSSGTAYNVPITDIKYTMDAGYKNNLGSSNIGSYIRHVLITGMECSYIRDKFNGVEYKRFGQSR